MNHLGFDEFHQMCSIDNRTKNRTFFNTGNNCGYRVYYKNFLMDCIWTKGDEKLTERLKAHCLFCFDEDDNKVCCSQWDGDFSEVEYYCFSCQFTILFSFSKNMFTCFFRYWF